MSRFFLEDGEKVGIIGITEQENLHCKNYGRLEQPDSGKVIRANLL